MRQVIRKLIATLALAIPACAQPSDTSALEVYIVRHAEKIRTGDSAIDNNCTPGPRLTEEGFARSLALRDLLAEANLDGVFSTNCRRTIQTGILTAVDHGSAGERPAVDPASYAPLQIYDTPERLATELLAVSGRYLVIGHSNTLQPLIEALGADFSGGPIVTGENDRLYTVTRNSDGNVAVTGLCAFGVTFERSPDRALPPCELVR